MNKWVCSELQWGLNSVLVVFCCQNLSFLKNNNSSPSPSPVCLHRSFPRCLTIVEILSEILNTISSVPSVRNNLPYPIDVNPLKSIRRIFIVFSTISDSNFSPICICSTLLLGGNCFYHRSSSYQCLRGSAFTQTFWGGGLGHHLATVKVNHNHLSSLSTPSLCGMKLATSGMFQGFTQLMGTVLLAFNWLTGRAPL